MIFHANEVIAVAENNQKRYISDNPQLMAEWNWEHNNSLELYPENITCSSAIKVWWKCSKGHEWQAPPKDRHNRKRGCPYCAGSKPIVGETDLKTVNPILAQEWNYERNIGLSPEDFLPKSNKKVWWKCALGHEWQAAISHRSNNQGCPICSGKRILPGFNDLATTHPLLVEEWDYEKNTGILPTEISKGSEKKVWWKCSRGHSWNAAIYSRVSGVGCPHCANELQSSFPEKAIYYYIKKSFPDAISNYRSSKLSTLELDIFIPSLNIGIEYDGDRWHQEIEKDLHKNKLCHEIGIKLIRIREPSCPILTDELSIFILRQSKKSGLDKTIQDTFAVISQIIHIEYIPDINTNRDSIAILKLLNPISKENDILTLHPSLVLEWDYQKNGNILPNMITAGSDKKVWWICPLGHSYFSSVSSRVKGRGCPICAGKIILKGYNDFASKCPDLLSEWDYEKNTISPDAIAYGSDKKIWWKCPKGHSYSTSINNKRAGAKCPFCTGKAVLVGFNDLATTRPKLIEEWNYQKNELTPSNISAGSAKKVWWICSKCGFEWQTSVYSRTCGHGCPKCAKDSRALKAKEANERNERKKTQKKTHDYFIRELAIKNPNIQPLTTYLGAREKIMCKCLICGYEWAATPSNLFSGHGCPKCGNRHGWEKRKSKNNVS